MDWKTNIQNIYWRAGLWLCSCSNI